MHAVSHFQFRLIMFMFYGKSLYLNNTKLFHKTITLFKKLKMQYCMHIHFENYFYTVLNIFDKNLFKKI